VIEAALIGVAAGVVAGLFGVGGGTLFVPALTIFLGLSHIEAEATSLLAIVPVAVVGAWRQHGYGNLALRDGVTVGVLAVGGAVLGVVLANALPERALEIGFAVLLLVVAGQMTRRALRPTLDA
jgi:uncharacterized membrane protein YfcA